MAKIIINKITENCIELSVPSSRGGEHTVRYNRITNKWTCTCEDYFYRERFCKHMQQARTFLENMGLTHISNIVVTNDNKESDDVDVITELLNIKKQLYSLRKVTDSPEIESSIKSVQLLIKQQRNLAEL